LPLLESSQKKQRHFKRRHGDAKRATRKTEPVVEKIRRGEVSVFVAVAEELPEVFRTHVVPKLGLFETLDTGPT
jgi:hypothetical protein